MDGKGDYSTVFRDVTFEADAHFVRSEFRGETIFDNVIFEQEANFSGANFEKPNEKGKLNLFLSHVKFANMRIKWDQLSQPMSWVREGKNIPEESVPKPEQLSEVFKNLENYFRGRHQLADANEAHYHRKIVELAEARKTQEWHQRLPIEAEWYSWGWFFSYGTNLWVGSGVVSACLFDLRRRLLCEREFQTTNRSRTDRKF